MLGLLREKNCEEFLTETKGKTLNEVLSKTVEFNSYRSYFKIDSMGAIKYKKPNMSLIKLTLLGEKFLPEYFNEGLYITEKRKIHKIDRLSSVNIETLEKNLYKVFYNRDLSISYRYAKEFILKDKSLFVKKLSHFILLDDVKSNKALLTLAFMEALNDVNKKNIDSVLYSYLPYIVTYPTRIVSPRGNSKDIYEIEKLDLNALAYLNLVRYGYEEFEQNYFSKLSNYLGEIEGKETEVELFERLSENRDELYKVWHRVTGSDL